MAEIGLAASIIAVIEISTKLITHTRQLITKIKKAPYELHLVHIEALTLSGTLHSLQSFHDSRSIPQRSREKLEGWNGLVEVCRRTLSELDKLLAPSENGESRGMSWNYLSSALKESKTKPLIEDLRRFTSLIKVALLDDFQYQMSQNTAGINALARGLSDVQTTWEVKHLDDLLHWISPLNVSYRQSYLTACDKRFGDTGSWLLSTSQYQQWITRDGDTCLCLWGPPGSGKTVLSAVVIQDRQKRTDTNREPGTCVLYYYFDMRDAYKNSTAGLYDSLVRQLLHYYPLGYAQVLELAKKTYWEHPTTQEYIELIRDLLSHVLATSTVCLIIDGCDMEECTDFKSFVLVLTDWVSSLKTNCGDESSIPNDGAVGDGDSTLDGRRLSSQSSRQGHLKLFLTTRNRSMLRQLYYLHISMVDGRVAKDIRKYVEGQIQGMSQAAQEAMGHELQEMTINSIVGKCDELFIQARLHVERITQLETVEQIERSIANLPGKNEDAYMSILQDILCRYPGEENLEILQKMFVWLCQAKYCLPVAEFVAVVTLKTTKDNLINKKTIPWNPEAFCLRLGPFLNIDYRPTPPEINLSHATMEEYLQGQAILSTDDASLKSLHVSPAKAQRYLAEFCIAFLGCSDFKLPLSTLEEFSHQSPTNKNPFKCIPGGLGIPLDPKKYKWIGPMQRRLKECLGLEYSSINWHHHLKRAARGINNTWVRERIMPLLDWFLNEGDPRYKSWQEAHAYFCHELETDCKCGEWQSPRYFLETFELGFLLPFLGDCDNAVGTHPETTDGESDGDESDQSSEGLCASCQGTEASNALDLAEVRGCENRSFKLFQRPGMKYRAHVDSQRYRLDEPDTTHEQSQAVTAPGM